MIGCCIMTVSFPERIAKRFEDSPVAPCFLIVPRRMAPRGAARAASAARKTPFDAPTRARWSARAECALGDFLSLPIPRRSFGSRLTEYDTEDLTPPR